MITPGKTENISDATADALKVSRRVHPEDFNVGDHVAISEIIYEYGTFCWCGLDSYQYPPDELIRLTVRPSEGHQPLTVKSICLPLVHVKKIDGKHTVLDLRQTQLVRLDPTFAAAVRKSYKSDLRKEKKKKRKKKRTSNSSN